jgi:hypothetical protein
MNFDNNGMKFELNTSIPNSFIMDVYTDSGKQPSFGINSQKTFVNNLFVDSNGNGLYKRVGKTRTLNIYLIKNLLEGNIEVNDLDNYLDTMEIVNAPNFCTHNLITDKNGNVWVVEPGRRNIRNKANESPYFVMTNFSIIDYNAGKKYTDWGFDRYTNVKKHLDKKNELSIKDAFDILKKVKQNGEWITEFSMVYSKNESKVYYCYNTDYNNILEYKFEKQ